MHEFNPMLVEVFVIFFSLLVAIPLLIVGYQCWVFLFCRSQTETYPSTLSHDTSFAILIPAHNEQAIISKTLTKLISALPDANPKRITLVADNCTDQTALLAESQGVNVLIRNNDNQRGKGFALDYGIQYLRKHNKPDILVIFDADCETDKTSLNCLIQTALVTQQPSQMTYLMRIMAIGSLKQKIAGFAWLLKNKIRTVAMQRMALPVNVSGTGMAFPWHSLESVQLGNDNIVENIQLTIDCAVRGFLPILCEDALVYSAFPEQTAAELTQRTRWEHGHLQTIIAQLPALVKESWQRKSWPLLALALDIGVPPLSLQVMVTCLSLFLLLILPNAISATAFTVLLLSFSFFAAMLIGVWWHHGRAYLSIKELAGIPFYVMSKLSIYFGFIFKRQKDWVRTDRDH